MKNPCAIPLNACRATLATMLLGAVSLGTVCQAVAANKVKAPRQSRRVDAREIESLEEQWRGAVVSGDSVLMEKLLSDDFLAISARGTLSDKQQYLQRIANHATQFTTFNLMDLKVRVQPGSAVAVSQANVAGTLEGRPIQGTFRYTKVYIRGSGGSWKMTNFEATRVSTTVASGSDMDRGLPLSDRDQHREH